MDCEVCGQSRAVAKARIDNVVFSVCELCARSGTIVEMPATKTKIPLVETPVAEEIVVPEFSKIIQQARAKLNLKQDELAKKMNEKLAVFSAVESGKKLPDIKLAKKLESFLKIKILDKA